MQPQKQHHKNNIKKVRSASFDEIKLDSQRTAQYFSQSSTDSQSALLTVPSGQQRSRSFDSAGIESSDVNASFLDIPKPRFARRKSSAKSPICIHCQYVEEQRKRGSTAGFYFDAQEFRALTSSFSSDSSDSDYDDDDDYEDDDEERREREEAAENNNNNNNSNNDDDDDEEHDIDYYFQNQKTLLLPSPCSITFTLSPTNCDFPAFPCLPGVVVPPPALPSSPPPVFPTSPTIEFTHELDEIEVPGPRQRRRSISRQEAIVVEPTGTSLENVSKASDYELPVLEIETDEPTQRKTKSCEPFVRDIFLTVPDLKRDRAASVDSCFTKVSSKTEEVQMQDGDLNLLTVPSSGAVRSRSVDIVLPTEQQARYKALALAGPQNFYSKG